VVSVSSQVATNTTPRKSVLLCAPVILHSLAMKVDIAFLPAPVHTMLISRPIVLAG